MNIGNNTGLLLARSRVMRQAKNRAMSRTARNNTSGRLSGNYRSSSMSSALNRLQSSTSNSISSTVSTLQARSNYRMIQESADDLQGFAEKLLAKGEDSLFGKAIPQTGDQDTIDQAKDDADTEATDNQSKVSQQELAVNKQKVVKEITNFVDAYNTMVERMTKIGDSTQKWYLRELKGYVSDSRTALATLGITQNSDGTLKVNQSVLRDADVEKMQKVFGSSNSFAEETAKLAKSIETSAEAGLKSLNSSSYQSSSNYNRYGNAYNNMYGSSGSWFNYES